MKPRSPRQQQRQDTRDRTGRYAELHRAEAANSGLVRPHASVSGQGALTNVEYRRPTGRQRDALPNARQFIAQLRPGVRVETEDSGGKETFEVEGAPHRPGGFGHPDSARVKLRLIGRDGTLADYRIEISADRLAHGFGPAAITITSRPGGSGGAAVSSTGRRHDGCAIGSRGDRRDEPAPPPGPAPGREMDAVAELEAAGKAYRRHLTKLDDAELAAHINELPPGDPGRRMAVDVYRRRAAKTKRSLPDADLIEQMRRRIAAGGEPVGYVQAVDDRAAADTLRRRYRAADAHRRGWWTEASAADRRRDPQGAGAFLDYIERCARS